MTTFAMLLQLDYGEAYKDFVGLDRKLGVRGYYTFTKEDIEKQFPSAGKVYIKTALYRLASKSKIVSPWRNFYVIMPVEYSLKGVIPPVFLYGSADVLSWEKILCCSF